MPATEAAGMASASTSAPGAPLPTICLVGELPPPTGGMAVQAERLAAGLRAAGHPVRQVRCNALAAGNALRRIKGLRGLINGLLFLCQLLPAVPRAQVVHVFSHSHLSFFLFTWPSAALARLLGKRLVIHYHGGAAATFLAGPLGRWALPALRAADALIVPSGFLVEVFARFGLQAEAIPNILDLDRFAFRARQPLQPRILMARHLTDAYNPACGLRAFALLAQRWPEASLVVAGDGPLRADLLALCEQLGIGAQVRFTGNIDNRQMLALFEQAHILLNSSRVDNQPVSLLEAFACGVLVVSTAVGGIPYMCHDGVEALLGADDDAAALAALMARLLDDPAQARAQAERALERVRHCGWPQVYAALRPTYGLPPPATTPESGGPGRSPKEQAPA